MTTIDNDVLNIVALATFARIGRQGFGLPLLVGPNNGSNLIQVFETPAEAAAARAADDISVAQLAALNLAFAQPLRPRAILVGKRLADVSRQVDFLIDDDDDGNYTITLNGVDFTFAAVSQTAAQIATSLVALIDANAAFNASVQTSTTVRVTAAVLGADFDFAVDAPNDNIVVAASVAAVNLNTTLDALRDERNDFYGVALDSRTDLDNTRLAQWCALNNRFGVAQSSAAALLTNGADWTTPLAANQHILVCYRASDSSYAAFALMTQALTVNLDQKTSVWAFKTVIGELAENITAAQKQALAAKRISYYLDFAGVPVWFAARMRGGLYADERTTLDWTLARTREALATLLLSSSQRNDKIPYNDEGISICAATVQAVLSAGERIGHFNDNSTRVRFLPIAELSQPDRDARRLVFEYGGVFSGAVQAFSGIGYFSIDVNDINNIFGE